MTNILFLFFLTLASQVLGQSFSVSESSKNINMEMGSGIVHDYIALTNNTNKKLNLKWIKLQDVFFPRDWKVYLQDPQTWYNPLDGVDSANFFLDSVASFTNKMIIQIDHKGIASSGTIGFIIFPIDNRNDSVVINFYIQITEASGINHLTINKLFTYSYLRKEITYDKENVKNINLYNSIGVIQPLTFYEKGIARVKENMAKGTFIISIETYDNHKYFQKIYFDN